MKHLALFTFLLILSSSIAQQPNILIRQDRISDLSQTHIYPRLVDEIDGRFVWKEDFKYLDSIEIYGITYLSDGLKVNGLLVKPKKSGKYPCVIYNRGGNGEFGALKIAHAAITLGQIAKEGYVVIASQYRGNAGGEGKDEFGGDEVNDVVILPKVLSEIDGADTSRIGMYGWSRGGMMTYMALTRMSEIKAAVAGGALSDAYSNIKDRPEMESGVNAIIPDTVAYYPVNNHSYFDLQIGYFNHLTYNSNCFVMFSHKMDSDSLHDGGYLTTSMDGGETWNDVFTPLGTTQCNKSNTPMHF